MAADKRCCRGFFARAAYPLMPFFRPRIPWTSLAEFEQQLDQLLSRVRVPFLAPLAPAWPPVNVYETADCYFIAALVPGCGPDAIDVVVQGSSVTLRGARTPAPNVPDDAYRRRDRFTGPWERQLSFPEPIDEEGVQAEFSHGLLRIRLPKTDFGKPHQIRVHGETTPAVEEPR